MPPSLFYCRQGSVKLRFYLYTSAEPKIGAALVKLSLLSLGYWIEGKSLASGGSVFVLGRRAGRVPNANSEHLRKRLAGKNYVVTQTGESQEIWSQDRDSYLNSFWHGKNNCEVLTPRPWDTYLWNVLVFKSSLGGWRFLPIHYGRG